MKQISFLIVFVFTSTIIFAQTKTNWSPEQCLKLKNISGVAPSPDGSKVLYTVREAVMTDDRSEYVNQVFLCNSDGSNTIQLTKGDKNSGNPKWSPDGKWIAFTSSRDGKNNLYILPVGGGEARRRHLRHEAPPGCPYLRAVIRCFSHPSSCRAESLKLTRRCWYFHFPFTFT